MIRRLPVLVMALVMGTINGISAQEWAQSRLEDSPRHLEWIVVKHGDRQVNFFIAYPEVK